jgi:hypothetical protein
MKKDEMLNTRTGKYFVARKKGKNKTEAKIEAGYAITTPTNQIERSEVFNTLEKVWFRDALLSKITMSDIVDEQIKVIKQDKDLSAKNTAIKTALERIEPESNPKEEQDKVIVVLKS